MASQLKLNMCPTTRLSSIRVHESVCTRERKPNAGRQNHSCTMGVVLFVIVVVDGGQWDLCRIVDLLWIHHSLDAMFDK